MAFTIETAVGSACADLSHRLGIDRGEIETVSAAEHEFANGALGAPTRGEMAAMMLTSGWKIRLRAAGEIYEYRADLDQLRLHNFRGENYVIK